MSSIKRKGNKKRKEEGAEEAKTQPTNFWRQPSVKDKEDAPCKLIRDKKNEKKIKKKNVKKNELSSLYAKHVPAFFCDEVEGQVRGDRERVMRGKREKET